MNKKQMILLENKIVDQFKEHFVTTKNDRFEQLCNNVSELLDETFQNHPDIENATENEILLEVVARLMTEEK